VGQVSKRSGTMSTVAFFASAASVALTITAASAGAAVIDVHLKGQRFDPTIISAKPGDTIMFHNDDVQLHSVLLPDNKALLAEHFIDPNTSYEVTIPTTSDPLTYNLVCTIHLGMRGTLQIIAK
jgi:plastocyanin